MPCADENRHLFNIYRANSINLTLSTLVISKFRCVFTYYLTTLVSKINVKLFLGLNQSFPEPSMRTQIKVTLKTTTPSLCKFNIIYYRNLSQV